MSGARLYGCRHLALGLAWMSVLACNSDLDRRVPGGQPCERGDECEDDWVCFQGFCRKVCNRHQDCAKTEACEPGVCLPVPDYKCDEDTDCNAPSGCQSIFGAECYAGQCHYDPVEEGLPCDDENICTSNDACDSNGTCRGEEMACDTPPGDSCSEGDSMFRHYESTGTCSTLGSCEYEYVDSECADCGHECLGLPMAPQDLMASAGDAQVTLTWSAIAGAQSYNVYASQTVGGTANAVPVSAASSPHMYTDLGNGYAYYFAVAAVIDAGVGDLSSEVSATPRISAPAAVSAGGADQQVILTWEAVSGADKYHVYWAQEPGVTVDSSRLTATTSPYAHGALDNNTTYYFALAAVDGPSESVLSGEVSASTAIDTATKLVAPDAQALDLFGGAVALSGDYALVGASGEDGGDGDPMTRAGAAYVFKRTAENTWDAGTKLVAHDAQTDDAFGVSVALDGDYAVVGAYVEDGGDGDPITRAGAAYVFKRTAENTWDAGTKLVAFDAQTEDRFGDPVALSGDYALVGAYGEDGGDGDPMIEAGAAYVFRRTGENTWDAGTKLVAPDAQAGDWFGCSVALRGDYALVGARNEDGGVGSLLSGAGAAYVFRRTGENTWDAGTKLVAPDAQEGDWFGHSAALSGNYALVGAYAKDGGDGDPMLEAGAAYVFRRTGENTWDAGTKLVAPDAQEGDLFGDSAALSDDHVVVGAEGAGAAYLFLRTGEDTWNAGTKLVAPDAQGGGWFGRSVALSVDYAIVGASGEDARAGVAYVYAH